jgi:hypothetical protein
MILSDSDARLAVINALLRDAATRKVKVLERI